MVNRWPKDDLIGYLEEAQIRGSLDIQCESEVMAKRLRYALYYNRASYDVRIGVVGSIVRLETYELVKTHMLDKKAS